MPIRDIEEIICNSNRFPVIHWESLYVVFHSYAKNVLLINKSYYRTTLCQLPLTIQRMIYVNLRLIKRKIFFTLVFLFSSLFCFFSFHSRIFLSIVLLRSFDERTQWKHNVTLRLCIAAGVLKFTAFFEFRIVTETRGKQPLLIKVRVA